MGQELLEIQPSDWKFRSKRRFYLATNSKGYKVVRGSSSKELTHATIAGDLTQWGWCYATFTTRLDLAQRYSKRWKGSEVVEVKEITTKEARQHRKEIEQMRQDYLERQASNTAKVYEIDRNANGN